MSSETDIRPFRVEVPEEAIADLRPTYFNEVAKGGHFAAWEEPLLFSEEVRAAFRPLR